MSNRTFYASTYVVADGVTRTWPFSFAGVNTGQESGTAPYLYPEDVKVQEIYTDSVGNKQTVQRTGVLGAPNQITIDGPAIIAGREIRIYRETELRFPLVDYRDLQSVSEHDLDLANRQAVFIAQETRDAASANLLYDAQGHYNAGGRKIVNMAPGTDAKDAVNMDQFCHTIRGTQADEYMQTLPPALERRGKVLTFDGATGQPTVQFPTTSSALELEMRLASAAGAGMIGYRNAGAGAAVRTVYSRLAESVSVLDYFGNPENNISLAITAALVEHDTVHIPPGDWYGGPASAADEYLVVMMRKGKRVVFMPGARVFFGQTGTTYLPFFASISQTGWTIDNPSFVWTGKIQWSATGDLQYSIPDPVSPLVARLGAPHAYQAYIYNAAILALSSHGFQINNFKIESLDPSRPILQGISTARTGGLPVEVHGLALDDTNVGLLAQGGDTLIVTNIKQGRSNQDIGIPGHAVYSFVKNTIIDGVVDTGIETGAERQSGYTISYKGEGTFLLSNVVSRRALGPVGWATAAGKAECISLSNILWEDSPAVAIPADATPVIYNAGTPDNNDSTLTMTNVVLRTTRDRAMLGGHIRSATGGIVLRRRDMATPTTAYLKGRFIKCDLDITLEQRGTSDAAVLQLQSGGGTLLTGNRMKFHLDGFNSTPRLDYSLSDGRWQSNTLIFDMPKVKPDGTAATTLSLGSPDTMMPNTSVFTKGQNFVGTTDATASWRREFPAGVADIVAEFPLSAGTHEVTVTLSTVNGAWRRTSKYQVTMARPDGVGAYMLDAQKVGNTVSVGNTPLAGGAEVVVSVPEVSNLRIACTIAAPTALAQPVIIHCSTTRTGL